MKPLELKGPPEKIVDPDTLERLFAEGLTLKQVAKEMNIGYSSLSTKINRSLTLMQARTRGERRAK